MNVLVLGLGSMGKRRIKILQKIDEIKVIYGFDMNPIRRRDVCKELGIIEIENIDCLSKNISAVFISTSPQSHEVLISEMLKKNLHIFTEINLSNIYYDEIMTLAKEKELKLFLSSTFLYRKELEFINDKVLKHGRSVNYTYHVGQYLPDWHPWENYKDYFISKKDTNGCRELLSIELPWITKVFGSLKSFHVAKQKQTNLEINYQDSYALIFEHVSGCLGTVFIDLVSRPAVRDLSIFGENFSIKWQGKPNTLEIYEDIEWKDINLYDQFEQNNAYAPNIIEDAYQAEVIEFLAWINGEIESPRYSFEQDKIVLDIVENIERIL